MFLLLTRIYNTAGVPVVSPGKDIPGVVEVLNELRYLNDFHTVAHTPDQSFSRQRDGNNKAEWTAERLDSVWDHKSTCKSSKSLYICMYEEI